MVHSNNSKTYYLSWLVMICLIFTETHQNSAIDKGFDDSVLFNLNWLNSQEELLRTEDTDGQLDETIIVTTHHKEKYLCGIPSVNNIKHDVSEKYTGPSPMELLGQIFVESLCTFKLELYWTYEVCHGRYIRQYHEDREGKTVKVQEYILGKWSDQHLKRMLLQAKEKETDENVPIPTKKIDNINIPYFEVVMENGTLCELNNNKPRITKILYVCYIHGKHEIYSLKEISTCVYEIIILTPLLCAHPKYKSKDTGEHKINCFPIDNKSHKMPYSLAKLLHNSYTWRRKAEKDRFKVELIKVDKEEPEILEKKPLDSSPVESFLLGKNCLNGGTGWWKFEFCYGKFIEQYHVERDGKRISINLGEFDREAHLEWIKNNPQKRPKPLSQRKQLSHFYSNGDVCDKTAKPRQTEVKLKCLRDPPNPNAVALYLLEPKACEYILGVESPLICDILSRADEDGLVEPLADEFLMDSETSPTIHIKL